MTGAFDLSDESARTAEACADRRALVVLGAALVCFAVAPLGLADDRDTAVMVGCAYAVLAVPSCLGARSRVRRRRPWS